MNYLEGLDLSLSNSYNNSLLDEKNNIFPFSIDESDVPQIKDEKTSIAKNLFKTKKTIKEKINHQKLLLEQKRGLTEKDKKAIYFDKKEDLKRRNREAAQKSRDKKKLEFMRIIEENRKLKDEIYIINSKINLLCSGCKTIFDHKNEDIQNNNICVNCSLIDDNKKNIDEGNDILNSASTSSLFVNLKIQKLFNFILISLFTLFCIFGLISNIPNYNNFDNKPSNKMRNMKEKEDNRNFGIYNNDNNISKLSDYFLKKNNYIDSHKFNINDKFEKKDKNNNYKYEICSQDFFTSFQCYKKPFLSKMVSNDTNEESFKENINSNSINNDYKNYINNSIINNNKKNSIYFKLFLQSCSKDEDDNNENIKDNKHTHYIFSSDNNMCQEQDFYFFCKRTEN